MDEPVERIYDLVVFGASGFTGQFVVEEVARKTDDISDFKWAVAGRNDEKLQKCLERANQITGIDLSSVGVIIADVSDRDALTLMCKKTKLVLNCVGPYRFYGEPVVSACVENGSHHIDISGEPWFLEAMDFKFSEQASEAGVYVIGACGFDSIPADYGVEFTRQKFPGTLNTVESYLSLQSGPKGGKGNFATWHSAVYGFANAGDLAVLRKANKKEPLPKYTPKLQKRPTYFFHDQLQRWCVPFPGADASVVRRSQRHLYTNKEQRPVQYGAYFSVSGLLSLISLLIGGFFFGVMAKFGFTRNLLLKFPSFFSMGVFSKDGPTREQIDGSTFTINFFAEGFSSEEAEKSGVHDVKLATKVSGPEAGYSATPIIMVQTALALLQEQEALPGKGGVLPALAAFSDTTLLSRLQKNGINFSVVESG